MPSPDIFSELRPYQVEAVQTLARSPAYLLVFEQRLGKTPCAIRAADLVGARRIFVACPAVAVTMWHRAFERWAQRPHKVDICSWDRLSRLAKHAGSDSWDVVILDEGQYAKTPTAKRTVAVYGEACTGSGLIRGAKHVWVLSGTLTPNGVHELYPHLRALFPETISWAGRPARYWEFVERYCHTRLWENRKIIGGARRERIGELREKLRGISMRLTRDQVAAHLPAIQHEEYEIPRGQLSPMLFDTLRLGTLLEDSGEIDRMLTAVESGQALKMNEGLTRWLRLTGIVKAPAVAALVHARLEEGAKKIVVFFWHRDVGRELHLRLSGVGAVYLDGSTPAGERQRAIDSFQTDPAVRVFIGQIKACGTAIDLSAADNAIFAELSAVPADNAQAEKRIDSLEKNRGLLVTVASLPYSADQKLTRLLMRKTRDITQLWQTEGKDDSSRIRGGYPAGPGHRDQGISGRC